MYDRGSGGLNRADISTVFFYQPKIFNLKKKFNIFHSAVEQWKCKVSTKIVLAYLCGGGGGYVHGLELVFTVNWGRDHFLLGKKKEKDLHFVSLSSTERQRNKLTQLLLHIFCPTEFPIEYRRHRKAECNDVIFNFLASILAADQAVLGRKSCLYK